MRYVPSYSPTEEPSVKNIALYGTNTIQTPENDTTVNWKATGTGFHFYTKAGQLNNQPSTWGFLVNYVASNDVFQIWHQQNGGPMYLRSGNASGWNGSWKKIAYYDDIKNGALKIQKNGTDVASFTANSASDVTANILVPTKMSDLTNDNRVVRLEEVSGSKVLIDSNGDAFSPSISSDSVIVNGDDAVILTDKIASLETDPIPSSRISYLEDSPKVTRLCITNGTSDTIVPITLVSGRQVNLHIVNAGTGYCLENADGIDFMRVWLRVKLNAVITGTYGIHGCTTGTTVWSYCSGVTSEHTGSWYETHTIESGVTYGDAIIAYGGKNMVAFDYSVTRLHERTIGLMGSVMCSGSGSNVHFNIECNAKDLLTLPSLYQRSANNTNVTSSTGIIEIYEK